MAGTFDPAIETQKLRDHLASHDKPIGDDPVLPDAWLQSRPDARGYTTVLTGWRNQTTAPPASSDDASLDDGQPATRRAKVQEGDDT
jgi:hypothetical protein